VRDTLSEQQLILPNGRQVIELMAFHSYIVAAGFHTRVDAIEAMKQVVAEVTAPSLDEEGSQIYHWSQGADDPTLFYCTWNGGIKRVLRHTLLHRT
jgi:hypothetical protein